MLNQHPAITLATIVGIADLLMDTGNKEAAANALAFVIEHPTTSDSTRERAIDLFNDLEAELCPRVIWDARARAQEITLQQVVLELEAIVPR